MHSQSLSCVWVFATPWTVAQQAPLSMGFIRQEHWNVLPCPSPVHESEKWKWSSSVVRLLATPWTAAYQAPRSMGFSRQEYWNGLPFAGTGQKYLGKEKFMKFQNPKYEFFSYWQLFIQHLHCIRYCIWDQSLGQEDPLEREMATHSRKIPWTKEPGRLQSMGLQRVGQDSLSKMI